MFKLECYEATLQVKKTLAKPSNKTSFTCLGISKIFFSFLSIKLTVAATIVS